jgi:hypothetical protein
MAFGVTLLGTFFLVPGLIGCRLHESDWSIISCTPWSETVLWREVWAGAAVLLVATYLWRRAIHLMALP